MNPWPLGHETWALPFCNNFSKYSRNVCSCQKIIKLRFCYVQTKDFDNSNIKDALCSSAIQLRLFLNLKKWFHPKQIDFFNGLHCFYFTVIHLKPSSILRTINYFTQQLSKNTFMIIALINYMPIMLLSILCLLIISIHIYHYKKIN